jgi:biopolymer transport protein TolR
MARKESLRTLKELSEISYTPLIDLSMLLLVTFLITYPLMEQGVHINLPVAKADDLKPANSLTVSIDAAGKIFLDNRDISIAALSERLGDFHATDPHGAVYVRADRELEYGRVMDVLRILHGARIAKMTLVTSGE